MARLIIFDFDGTIADTKAVYYKAMSKELESMGFSKDSIDKAIDVGMSLRKTLGKLGLRFLSRWILQRSIMKQVEYHTEQIKKCKDVDSIKKIKDRKILVTNSLKEFALPILKHLKLKREFEEIYGADDFSDKADFIAEYIEKRKLKKSECFYVGDRVADVNLARSVGCVSVVVSGSCAWNSKKDLLKAKPDFILSDINELKKVLDKNR